MNTISSHRQPPILNIYPEILWNILSILTEGFWTDNALKSIRLCSQLCQFWRQCILDSPSIWGKLINFNEFCHSKDQWMEEVMRRSGSTLLWIKGPIHGETADRTKALETFFFSILNNHWDRIQRIHIGLWRFDAQDHYNWTAVLRPAPHLQIFKVSPPFASVPWFSMPCLFADHAPNLHIFNAHEAFPIYPEARWLSALRTVNLCFPLALPEILDALGAMNLLESLTISIDSLDRESPMTHADTTLIDLPNLSQLWINSNLSTTLHIIAALRVASSCSFQIYCTDTYFTLDAESSSLTPLFKLIQNYFHSYRPKKVWLTARRCEYLFSDCDSAYPEAPRTSNPLFVVRFSSSFPLENIHSLFRASSFLSANMSSVMDLHVDAETHFALDICQQFFSSLSSIIHLTLIKDMVSYLSFIEVHQAFPLLRLVRFKGGIDMRGSTVIKNFEESRNAAGRPVLIVSLPN
ncbi:hypothetical protein GALMADRAFT_146618 [Galerina marginata CBS 339.88]|uniref:F-box domain-containing protein n=1 Tax=Galerina marginata (strain CBS 339.88) TaxID=685588 RepID=A0A067SK88_GALM3|nr:hypothetical protein GALMADRAFT_146618 [Galerina marginata CBS 339.88]